MLKVGGSAEGASVAPAMPGAEQGGRRRPIRLDPSSKGRPGTAITPKPIRPSRPALHGAETASDSVATSPRARAHDLWELSKLASLEVVVDQSGRLHQRVGGGRPDEAKAAPLQLLCHRLRFRRAHGHLVAARGRRGAVALRREGPQERVEDLSSLVQGPRRDGVRDRGLDLAAVAHDPGVREEPLHVALPKGGDSLDVPIFEGAPEALALAQDRKPGKSRLKRLEDKHLEELTVAVHGAAPDAVVVLDVLRCSETPPAAQASVGPGLDPHRTRRHQPPATSPRWWARPSGRKPWISPASGTSANNSVAASAASRDSHRSTSR